MGGRIKHASLLAVRGRFQLLCVRRSDRKEPLMMRKAFVAFTLLVAVLGFGPSLPAHAGSAAPSTSAAVATATAEQPKSAEIKGTGAPIPNGYLLIDWNATTAVEVPAATMKQENSVFRLRAGTIANCGALSAGKPEMSFTGQEPFAAGITTVMAPRIHTADGCTCNEGDVCCCGDGWTCCNHDRRCCCSIVVLEQ